MFLRPFAGPGGAPFRLYADKPATYALNGELDRSCTDLFATTVERVLPVMEPADEMVIDGTGLTFVDHRALLTLDHHLGRLGVQGLLRTPCSTATRLAELLGLSCLRMEQVPVQSASGDRDGRARVMPRAPAAAEPVRPALVVEAEAAVPSAGRAAERESSKDDGTLDESLADVVALFHGG